MWESSGAEKGRLIPFNTFISHCIAPKPLACENSRPSDERRRRSFCRLPNNQSYILLLVYQIKIFSKFQAELHGSYKNGSRFFWNPLGSKTRDFTVVHPMRTKGPLTSSDATVAAVPITHTMSVTFTAILSWITGFPANVGLAICTNAPLVSNS